MSMTMDARKALALDYLYALDNGGKTPSGEDIIDLFAEDASVYFPKWGVARGIEEIKTLLADIGAPIREIHHHVDEITWVGSSDSDTIVAEGTSDGVHQDGPWSAGTPAWGAGRWCDVFEIRDGKIHRVFIYLDPDYANLDTERYAWLNREEGRG